MILNIVKSLNLIEENLKIDGVLIRISLLQQGFIVEIPIQLLVVMCIYMIK